MAVAEKVRWDEGIAPDEVAPPKASNGAGNTTKRQDVFNLRSPNEAEIAGLKPVPGYRGERVKFIECVTSSDN